jgi:hypothetical protein
MRLKKVPVVVNTEKILSLKSLHFYSNDSCILFKNGKFSLKVLSESNSRNFRNKKIYNFHENIHEAQSNFTQT